MRTLFLGGTILTTGSRVYFLPRAQAAIAAFNSLPNVDTAYVLARLQRAFRVAAEDLGKGS